ncbi:MAG: flagellar biosynthesis protein FlhF [Pseudobutyrivibrio sp.]|nr:flagellar biosynthesis protein FlhF [Pseudobutyrivibrio sp.]
MTINKFSGKTEEEAKAKAREALGAGAVIMNVKEIRPKGMLGVFKSSTYEVTAAIEDDMMARQQAKNPQALQMTNQTMSGLNLVADEELSPVAASQTVAPQTMTPQVLEQDALKEAFSAVNEVLEASTSYGDSFTPLKNNVPKAKIVSPTYQRPQNAPAAPTAVNTARNIPVEELPSEALTAEPELTMDYIRESVFEELEDSIGGENHSFVKMLYNVLLDNEVQEKYINQVLEDMDTILRTSHSLDNLLSSVYQKMILKLGTPSTITVGTKRPKVVFFIGPTGVGKTTTIAKIASKFKVEENKKVALITADTYRMAAADQLRTYANILSVPLQVIYSADELTDTVKRLSRENSDLDVIMVDTIGFSHKNKEQKADTKKLVESLDAFFDKEVYLVVSATTKYKDLKNIADAYMEMTDFGLIFTKLDETDCFGNIFNMKLYTGADLSYVTCGQNVPEDIEIVNTQKLVKQLLGGK